MIHTVILGAGIIGASTAYYLTSSPSQKITILDPCPPASGASGKSGGFIARNWAGHATSSLANLSFQLHSQLSSEHGGAEKWGYRRARAVGVVGKNAGGGVMADLTRSVRLRYVEGKGKGKVAWIRDGVVQRRRFRWRRGYRAVVRNLWKGGNSSDPYLLTVFLVDEARRRGAEFIQATATKFDFENSTVKAVHAEKSDGSTLTLSCDNLVIATGPWTGPLSKSLLPKPIPISSYAGHSILIRPTVPLSADCLFMTLNTRSDSYHPEIFPRISGELYICGVNENLVLPPTPLDAHPRSKDISKLSEIADILFSEYTIEKEQLCFRPMTSHGEPFIGPVPGVKNVYVGAGHSFWGITLGPGTGKVVAEMILGEELSADIADLTP